MATCFRLEAFGRPLAPVSCEPATPQGSEVLLRVGACGVCHSDLHLADGFFDLGGNAKLDLTRGINPPRVLGHEIAGEVIAVGPEATGVAIGDRRVVYPWIGCGSCAVCAAGDEHLCARGRALGINRDGGFASHVLVPHPRTLVDYAPLPEALAATFACSGLTAYGALQKVGPLTAEDRLLIIGAGGVGLAAVTLAKTLIAAPVTVADIDPAKRAAALAAGAAAAVDPRDDTATRTLANVAAVIDFVGAGTTLELALASVRRGGVVVVVGLFGGSARISVPLLPLKATRIVGSYVGSLAEFGALMALARAGRAHAIPITLYPLAQANDVLAALKAGAVTGRAVLNP
jgi:alcohol dehydrogenase/propanol-preferring alcohol dehydrogenase